jgi:TetR/AcrR family tetracycline transcriptional repressor
VRDRDRSRREAERLERQSRQANERFDRQRRRVSERFDRAQAKLNERMNRKQELIVKTALKLLDKEGADSLTLRKLAEKLDIQAPALYWHFKNKTMLVDYMAEAILRQEFEHLEPRASDEPWQDWLVDICKRLRKAMLSHRDGGRIVTGAHLYPAVTLMKLFDVSLESLSSAGIDERRADLIVSTAVHFTFGRVIEEQSDPAPEYLEKFAVHEISKQYPRLAKSTRRTLQEAREGYDEFEDAVRLIVGYPE